MIKYFVSFFSGNIDALTLLMYIGSMCFVVFCATPLHEFAHAWTAVKLGDETPRNRGRLTINPKAHIDPIGIIMIFLFGFGYAKPVEVRMRNFKKPKRDMAIVALSGPLCNLLQAFISMFLASGFAAFSIKLDNPSLVYMYAFFWFAAVVNVNLAVFNLIPIPPLDGSRLLTALLPAKYYYKIMQYERYIMIALFVLLFTGVLSTPLSIISDAVVEGFSIITQIPFVLLLG